MCEKERPGGGGTALESRSVGGTAQGCLGPCRAGGRHARSLALESTAGVGDTGEAGSWGILSSEMIV